jgi:hypothetical protein
MSSSIEEPSALTYQRNQLLKSTSSRFPHYEKRLMFFPASNFIVGRNGFRRARKNRATLD